MQTKMVDLSLLSTAEVDWLNDYHRQTWEKVSKQMSQLVLFGDPKEFGRVNWSFKFKHM